eukprot:7383977-Prymnesium_polylepis.1
MGRPARGLRGRTPALVASSLVFGVRRGFPFVTGQDRRQTRCSYAAVLRRIRIRKEIPKMGWNDV